MSFRRYTNRVRWTGCRLVLSALVLVATAAPACGGDDGPDAVNCGDGLRGQFEACEGTDLGGQTCTTLKDSTGKQKYIGGTLACLSNCVLDESKCIGERCGNGIRDPNEACEGTDYGGQTCDSLKDAAGNPKYLPGGTLFCFPNCTLDETNCTPVNKCGNGVRDPASEECEGTDLGGEKCETRTDSNGDPKYLGGILSCKDNCTFDESGCITSLTCGNGVAESGEECDGDDLDSMTCENLPAHYYGGQLACATNCTLATNSCEQAGRCGDGIVQPGLEQCDPGAMVGVTCEDALGGIWDKGAPGCDPNTCKYTQGDCKVVWPYGNGGTGYDKDLVVSSGETVSLAAGKQYDFASLHVETGGVLEFTGGSNGWTVVGVAGAFQIDANGRIEARNAADGGTFVVKEPDEEGNPTGTERSLTITSATGGSGAASSLGGGGGAQALGNGGGGGGGRACTFGWLTSQGPGEPGKAAIENAAGNGGNGGGAYQGGVGSKPPGPGGAGGVPPATPGGNGGEADMYTGKGGGGGGARGGHGRGLLIVAKSGIAGSGTIDVSGSKGGNGGGGGSGKSSTGGDWCANTPGPGGGGGGGAGGSGGAIHIKYRGSVSGINLLISGGTQGLGGPRGETRDGDNALCSASSPGSDGSPGAAGKKSSAVWNWGP